MLAASRTRAPVPVPALPTAAASQPAATTHAATRPASAPRLQAGPPPLRLGPQPAAAPPSAGSAAGSVASAPSALSPLPIVPDPNACNIETLNTVLKILQSPGVQIVARTVLPSSFLSTFHALRPILIAICRLIQDPGFFIRLIQAYLQGLIAQVPDKARELVSQAVARTKSPREHLDGIWRHLKPRLEYLKDNWWKVIKDTAWGLVWPLPGVWEDLKLIWQHIASAINHFQRRSFSRAIDNLLAVWRGINSALGRLYGWIFLGLVIGFGIAGAVAGAAAGGVGALPGFFVGAGTGIAAAATLGKVLLVSTLLAEGLTISKSAYNLDEIGRTPADDECDYEHIANSGLTLAITLIMVIIGEIASRMAKAVIRIFFKKVWQLPALRGRVRTGPSRGDVIEVRVTLSEMLQRLLRGRRVTWLEAIRRNFPVIDLLEDGTVTETPRPGRAPTYTVTGGRLISVKSSIRIGADVMSDIQAWIRDLAGFRRVQNVTVVNPSGRTLIVALQTSLDDTTANALRAYAAQRGVQLQLTTELPPTHPATVFPDSLPAIMQQVGLGAAGQIPASVTCD